jgi:polysaccharide pyruvyl transferase WcaK-like protein
MGIYMSKKIVISGWYGPGNIGDEAILQAMVDTFEEQFPNCEITALSFNPTYTKNTQKINAVRQVPSSIKRWIFSFITLNIFKTFKAIKNCDLFVMGGGGFLSDWQPEVPHDWLKQMKIAKFFGKETWLYGIGAGPFLSDKGKKTTKYYIDNFVDKIIVRDKQSYRELKDVVGVSVPIDIQIDPVAKMNVDRYINKNDINFNSISIIVADHFNNQYWNDDKRYKYDLLKKSYLGMISVILKLGFSCKIVFFQKKEEIDLYKYIQKKFKNTIKYEFPENYKDAIITLNQSKAVISFRLHGNILAYALKKPYLPIIYHYKTDGFLNLIDNYPKFILECGEGENWKDIDPDPVLWSEVTKLFLLSIKDK